MAMNKNVFLTNESEIAFLDKIKSSLAKCKSFRFSVSFIKKAGLILLANDIEEALSRGVEGYLITSTYQNFTDIASLEMFLSWQEKYPNFKCKLDYGCFGEQGFHTKGYIFEYDDEYEVIIGSSNFTRFALLYNKEWDMSLATSSSDSVLNDVLKQFNIYWEKTYDLDRDIVKRYTIKLEYAIQSWDMDYCNIDENNTFKPNAMQKKALKEIKRFHDMNIDRCLVVAATGSGKTYLAAFDAQNFDAHKVLFIVHRDTILVDALNTFKNVFGNGRTYGLYTGQYRELDADFIFASNQMLARNVELFAKDEFDYIVIDEVHHAAASTYQKIISYFKPQFLLGLTATPERMDEKSVYELFGNNVPYDLRLREAIENDLVVPFHYYGIKDQLVSYEDDLSKEGIRRYIAQLVSDTHCSFVDSQIKKHLPTGKLKCIGFCKNIEHARLMAEGMQKYGYNTTYLTANDPTGVRIKKFEDLQNDNNPLNIIFAVDVLNEGVDIPAINMVLFLRPTESSAIFLQQLGRGLRKYGNKQYLTVLDFIGNSYKRSSQIAIALGTLSKACSADKRTIQAYIQTDFSTLNLPGVIIQLDKESKDEVLNSIEKTNFNDIKFLKQDYENFKSFLIKNGNIKPDSYPMPTDFLDQAAGTDLIKYTKKYDSYYDFLLKVESDVPYFNEEETKAIRTLSWFLPLVRKEEFLILKALMNGPLSKEELLIVTDIKDDITFKQAIDMLMKKVSGTLVSSFIPLVKFENDKYELIPNLNFDTFKSWFINLIEYGIEKFNISSYKPVGKLNLYCGYTGPKVFMAMNCRVKGEDKVNLMYMTGVHYINDELCLFVTLNKDAQKEERLKYQDYFVSDSVLHWESQTDTTLENTKGKNLLKAKKAHIFVRKTKKEDGIESPFIYIGVGELTNPVDSKKKPATLLFNIVLDNSVPYEYKYDLGIEDAEDEKGN